MRPLAWEGVKQIETPREFKAQIGEEVRDDLDRLF